jgi:hypothetical protein
MTTTLPTDGRQREHLESLRGLSVHVAIFTLVSLLIFLFVVLARGTPWFLYPLLGCGCGVVIHAEAAFFSGQSSDLGREPEARPLLTLRRAGERSPLPRDRSRRGTA